MIREYRTEDTESLIKIWRAATALALPFLKTDFVEQEAANLRDLYLPNTVTNVVCVDRRPIGFIAMIGNEIGGLFVHPQNHGQGLGRALVDHALASAQSLAVDVFEQNRIGRRFYDSYGFAEIGQTLHAPSGQAVITMAFARTPVVRKSEQSE